MSLPDPGYNVETIVDFENEEVEFNRKARKKMLTYLWSLKIMQKELHRDRDWETQ